MTRVREMRYWKIKPAPKPGDSVASHDGGVGVDNPDDQGYVSGPGNYSVAVQRSHETATGQRPIVLRDTRTGEVVASFNRGMARWFGLRLIEAAAMAEAFDVEGGGASSTAVAEVERLSQWLQRNAADRIEGSAVDTAIILIEEYKKARNAGAIVPPTPTERAIEAMRRVFKQAADEQQVAITLQARAVRTDAIRSELLTPAQIETDVIGWFSPSDQAVIRGLGLG